MMRTEMVHISQVLPGDTIYFDGHLRTVGKKDIKIDSFMGKSIFGDSFRLGYLKVDKVIS